MSTEAPLTTSPETPTIQEKKPSDVSVLPIVPQLPNEQEPATTTSPPPRDARFWAVFLSLCVASLLSALDLTAVSTALPTIVEDLGEGEFLWVGTAYALTSTAFLPWSGGLANIFGRRAVMLASLLFFTLGSALAGAAQTLNWLIAARAIQGVGGGGILSLCEIIVADLVPLVERGTFIAILGSVWAIASAIGPIIGGVFSESVSWRWLFYINLPLAGVAIVLILVFLNLKTPRDTFREKMERMDWIGNLISMGATTSIILALAWGGTKYSWTSGNVLAPLLIGLAGLVGFVLFERFFVVEPTIPFGIINNRTSLAGHIGTFIHGIVSCAVIYYLPTFLQACLSKGPVHSGIAIFPAAFTIAPFGIITGISVQVFKIYRPQNLVGWVFITVGLGLFTLLKFNSETGLWAGFQVVLGIGLGALYASTTFPILAPLPPSSADKALALLSYMRSLGQTFGISIGASVLQNGLTSRLPDGFIANVPGSSEVAYAAIPLIPALSPELQVAVKTAFAESLRNVWIVMLPFATVGLLSVLAMREVPMHTETAAEWGLEERKKEGGTSSA